MFVLLGLTSLTMLAIGIDRGADDADTDDFIDHPDAPETDPGRQPPMLLLGTDNSEWLEGSECDDRILGLGGHDDIRAGAGHDHVDGGDGNDVIYGDWSLGPHGNDTLLGGAGDDWISGEGGDDWLDGGTGNDTIFGGEGDDYAHGGDGDDWIAGGPGNDTLVAGPGADDLSGDEGDDLLIADDHDLFRDWLHGGEGDDTLIGVSDDWLEGGPGRDLFTLPAEKIIGHAPAILADFDPDDDRIELVLSPREIACAIITVDAQPDDSALVRLNGTAVAHVLNAPGLKAAQITLRIA